jgi:hypothetical protein
VCLCRLIFNYRSAASVAIVFPFFGSLQQQKALASRLFLKKILIARKSLYDRFSASRADPFSCVDARGKSKAELVGRLFSQSRSPFRVNLTFARADARAQSTKAAAAVA